MIEVTTELLQTISSEQAWHYKIIPKFVNETKAIFYTIEGTDIDNKIEELELLFSKGIIFEFVEEAMIIEKLSVYYRKNRFANSKIDFSSSHFLQDIVNEAQVMDTSDISYNNFEIDVNDSETSLSSINGDILGGMNNNWDTQGIPCLEEIMVEDVDNFVSNLNNQQSLTNNDNNDLFGMVLLYEKGFYYFGGHQKQYNGNISAVKWNSKHFDDGLRAYAYSYDNINRLESSTFKRRSTTGWDLDQNYYNTQNVYDVNGNIEQLVREGVNSTGQVQIDNLTYTYTGNRLTTVNDIAAPGTGGFEDNASLSTEYFYDNNGNLTEDKNKLITSITYNYLNLPKEVEFESTTNDNNIKYIYNALGQKLSKIVTKGTDIVNKYYLGGIEISDGNISTPEIEVIYTAEGRLIPAATAGEYDYEYYLKDHLGNIRVVFNTNVINNYPEVVTEDHYYPFGMQMPMLNYQSANTTSNKYKYNGKELQDDAFDTNGNSITDTKLDWCDYGARFYDPALGRWHVLDALANDEMQIDKSPYSYAWNTPINLTDPDGNCPWCIGLVVGAAVDYGAQVAMNYADGNESPWTDIDAVSILISAASGAATGGLSAIGKTGAKTAAQVAIKATAETAIEATESVAQQMNDNVKSGNDVMDISVTKVATDVVMSKVADVIPAKSVDTKQLNNTLDRAQRVAGDTPRASRAAAVDNAQSKVNTANAANTASKAVTGEVGEKVLQNPTYSVVSGSSGNGSSYIPPTYTQPSDNTRVATPIYPF